MAKPCSVCEHPKRTQIETEIINGTPYRDIEKWYGVGRSAISRHKNEGHLNTALVKAADPAVIAEDATLQDQLRDIHLRTLKILQDAESSGDVKVALVAIRECRSNLEFLAKLELVLLANKSGAPGSPDNVHLYLPENGRDNPDSTFWRDELNRKIGAMVEREVFAILGGQEIHFEGNSKMGQQAIGEAIGVLRMMCEAAGITPENVREKAKQASSEPVTVTIGSDKPVMSENRDFATEQSGINPEPPSLFGPPVASNTTGTNRVESFDNTDNSENEEGRRN